MPRAIMLMALMGGGIFVAVSYVAQLVHPGGLFADSASAASSIAANHVRGRFAFVVRLLAISGHT